MAHIIPLAGNALLDSVRNGEIIAWPYTVQDEQQVSLEWKTNIIETYNTEQRIALRKFPVKTITNDYHLSETEASVAQDVLTKNIIKPFLLPNWAEGQGLSRVIIRRLVIDIPAERYKQGDVIMIWESNNKYELKVLAGVSPNTIHFTSSTTRNYNNAYIMPMLVGRTKGGASLTRTSALYSQMKVVFTILNKEDSSKQATFPLYLGKEVNNERTVLLGAVKEDIMRTSDTIITTAGHIETLPKNSKTSSRNIITIDTLTRQSRSIAISWLHRMKGKQKSFWLPSWSSDLVLIASSTVLNIIHVNSNGKDYTGRHIMIILKNKMQTQHQITSKQANNEWIITPALPVIITPEEVELICLLNKARLDSDRISLKYGVAGRMSSTVPVKFDTVS